MTLWSIFRSPLIIGGNLTLCDEWTESLLTNSEVIAVDQRSTGNHAVITTDKVAVWLAHAAEGKGYYLAIFNLDAASQELHYSWKELGLPEGEYLLRDLWEHKDLGTFRIPHHNASCPWLCSISILSPFNQLATANRPLFVRQVFA